MGRSCQSSLSNAQLRISTELVLSIVTSMDFFCTQHAHLSGMMEWIRFTLEVFEIQNCVSTCSHRGPPLHENKGAFTQSDMGSTGLLRL